MEGIVSSVEKAALEKGVDFVVKLFDQNEFTEDSRNIMQRNNYVHLGYAKVLHGWRDNCFLEASTFRFSVA